MVWVTIDSKPSDAQHVLGDLHRCISCGGKIKRGLRNETLHETHDCGIYSGSPSDEAKLGAVSSILEERLGNGGILVLDKHTSKVRRFSKSEKGVCETKVVGNTLSIRFPGGHSFDTNLCHAFGFLFHWDGGVLEANKKL